MNATRISAIVLIVAGIVGLVYGGFSYTKAPGAEPTLWGAFNSATHMVDHVRGRGFDTRFDSAQFGSGATLKQKAWESATAVIHAAKTASTVIEVASA